MNKIGTERALFIAHKLRDEFIYNYAKAEGNSLTFAETQTVINGISIGGKKMSELHQIEHIRDSWDELIRQVKEKQFEVNKHNLIHFNSIVAQGENPEIGGFRQRPVLITGTNYMPPLPMLLNEHFQNMMQDYEQSSGYEKGFLLFLHTARNQYFADGNKRTGQLMMNGELMSQGYAPITIPPEKDRKYRDTLLNFYETNQKNGMMDFLLECSQEPRMLVMQQGADLSDAALERIKFIPMITGGSRPEVIFRDIALEALKELKPEYINWIDVERKTAMKAIGEKGYSASSVIEAIGRYSPTCLTAEDKQYFASDVKRMEPDLQAQYQKSKSSSKSKER